MRIGALIDIDRPASQVKEQVHAYAEAGYSSAWAIQIFGYDALTLLAAIGIQVPGIELGTGVVPVYSRIPQTMAQQALTIQAVTGGRFLLGIGMSHQVVVEGLWGIGYDRPASYLREYLAALMPLLRGERADVHGDRITAVTYAPLEIPDAPPPPVLVAALGPVMLELAGTVATGTVTWMTGTRTIAEHTVPTITAAAKAAGRPAPRVGASLPVSVTTKERRDAVKAKMDEELAIYPNLPSYKAMLDREGATTASDIALVGGEDEVASGLDRLTEAGATDFVASVMGNADERAATNAFLSAYAKRP